MFATKHETPAKNSPKVTALLRRKREVDVTVAGVGDGDGEDREFGAGVFAGEGVVAVVECPRVMLAKVFNRFSIRDLLWLGVVIGLGLGWMREHVYWLHPELPSQSHGTVILDGAPIMLRHGEKMEVFAGQDGKLDFRILNSK